MPSRVKLSSILKMSSILQQAADPYWHFFDNEQPLHSPWLTRPIMMSSSHQTVNTILNIWERICNELGHTLLPWLAVCYPAAVWVVKTPQECSILETSLLTGPGISHLLHALILVAHSRCCLICLSIYTMLLTLGSKLQRDWALHFLLCFSLFFIYLPKYFPGTLIFIAAETLMTTTAKFTPAVMLQMNEEFSPLMLLWLCIIQIIVAATPLRWDVGPVVWSTAEVCSCPTELTVQTGRWWNKWQGAEVHWD